MTNTSNPKSFSSLAERLETKERERHLQQWIGHFLGFAATAAAWSIVAAAGYVVWFVYQS